MRLLVNAWRMLFKVTKNITGRRYVYCGCLKFNLKSFYQMDDLTRTIPDLCTTGLEKFSPEFKFVGE